MCIKKEFKYDNNRIYIVYALLMNNNYASATDICYVNSKEEANKLIDKYDDLLKQYKNKYLKFDEKTKQYNISEELTEEFNNENKLNFLAFNIRDLIYIYKFGYAPLPKAEGRYLC